MGGVDLGQSTFAVVISSAYSRRVLERLGMRTQRATAEGVEGTAFYTLERRHWESAGSPGGAS